MTALWIIGIGVSAGAQLLLTMFFWGNLHSGQPATIQHVVIQGLVSIGALGWVVMTPFRWRPDPMVYGALAAVAAGQLCAWELLRRYDFVREWSVGPVVLLSMAVLSVALGFAAFVDFGTPRSTLK